MKLWSTPLTYLIGHFISLRVALQQEAVLTIIKQFILCAAGATTVRLAHALVAISLLTPADYGTFALSMNLVTIGTLVCGLGLRQALSISYFHLTEEEKKSYLARILRLYCFGSLLFAALFRWCFIPLVQLLTHSLFTDAHFICIGTIIFFSFFTDLHFQLLQYEQCGTELMYTQCTLAAATIFFTCFFVHSNGSGSVGALQGLVCGMAGIIILILFRRRHTLAVLLRLKKRSFISLLADAIPFIPGMLCAWIVGSITRFILVHYTSPTAVGIYATADTATQLFHFFVLHPWGGSYFPSIMKQFTTSPQNVLAIEEQNTAMMGTCVAAITTICLIGYFPGCWVVKQFLPSELHAALPLVPLLITGQIFLLASYFNTIFIQFHQQVRFLSYALCVPAMTTTFLSFLLIPSYELWGAVAASTISHALYFVIITTYNHHLRTPYYVKKSVSFQPSFLYKRIVPWLPSPLPPPTNHKPPPKQPSDMR